MSTSDLLKRMAKKGYTTMDTITTASESKPPLKAKIPILNLALSGSFDGGLTVGTTIFAGPSSSFKTALMLYFIKIFQTQYLDGVVFFQDTEGGTNYNMMKNFGVDMSRVFYAEPMHMHELHHNIQKIVEEVKPTDNVMLCVDSIGSVATASEIARASDDKITTDVGNRAKEIKSMFRTIAPYVRQNNIYALFLNHTYDTPSIYSERVMSGGSGPRFDAQNIIYLSKVVLPKELRRRDGDNRFKILTDKSRRIIDKSAFHIDVYQHSGIDPTSCLEDLAKNITVEYEGKQTSILSHYHGQYWDYLSLNELTGEVVQSRITKSDMQTSEFWAKMLLNKLFIGGVEEKYVINIDNELSESGDDIYEKVDAIKDVGVKNEVDKKTVQKSPKSKSTKKDEETASE